MSETFRYDVFLSHSSKDKEAVRELAERLKADGLRVWLDEWIIQPGDMIGLKIEEGLVQSRTLILVMSANAFASDWVTLEHHTALFRDPTNQSRRFIPLRLDDTEIKDILRQFAYVDWRERKEEQYARLLASCRPLQEKTKQVRTPNAKSPSVKILKGHTDSVYCVAMTPDGCRAVSGSTDRTVRVWDLETGLCVADLKGHTNPVWGVALTPDGRRAVSSSGDKTVRVWDLETGLCVTALKGHTSDVWCVALTPDGRRAVSGSNDKAIRVWDLETRKCVAELIGHMGQVLDVSITPDGRRAVSGSNDKTVRVWDLETRECVAVLRGHKNGELGVAITPDGRRAVSGSADKTVRMWNLDTGQCVATLEVHTDIVWGVALTTDGRRAVSGSADKTVRVWDLETGLCVTTLQGHSGEIYSVALTKDGHRVVSGSEDNTVRVWDLPSLAENMTQKSGALRYTNAKVLLVGDSGVGKSGLALRLAEDRFEATVSTDAVWATQLPLPHQTSTDDIEREIWLWDFAGQADYRLIHQLYMDETALAAFVFNPQSENPFEGLGQWDRDLQRAARRPFRKLLVAGRCDRGGLMVSRESIEAFRKERGFDSYLETSALSGDGCDALREAIVGSIAWENIPWTSSPRIFKILKEEIVKLKDEGRVLLRIGELKQHLEIRLPGEAFTMEELRAVVGLLAGPGVVWQLEFGDFVLLQPERINAYAAAAIRKVRAHIDELGIVPEEDVLAGRLDFQDMKRLPPEEEQIVLRAMHQTLVDHSLCLREHTAAGTLLVFPSFFRRERPDQSGHPAELVTYTFSGPLDEIYASLVVRLYHTQVFAKDQLWRFAADFKTDDGLKVGLKMTKRAEGAAEITVYCDTKIHETLKALFLHFIQDQLKARDPKMEVMRHYTCPRCTRPVKDQEAVRFRLEQKKKDISCSYCSAKVVLFDLIHQKFISAEVQQTSQEMGAQAQAGIDNESRELILIGHAFSIAGEAGQIFRPTPNSDWGLDGEIEFKNAEGKASGKRVYLQLKSGDSYLHKRQNDGKEIFAIKEPRWAEYWQSHAYPVMLVIRTSDNQIRWMDVSAYLKQHSQTGKAVRQIVFDGEPFTAANVARMRDRLMRLT